MEDSPGCGSARLAAFGEDDLRWEAPWAEWAEVRWDMVRWEVLTEWAVLVAPEDNDQIRYRNKKAAGASNEDPAVMRSIGSASLVQTVHDSLF